MSELSPVPHSEPIRKQGILRERMGKAKREALDLAMEKSDFTTKVINGQQGVMLDDFPRLLNHLGLKLVDVHKVCVTREIAQAYEAIARQSISGRSLRGCGMKVPIEIADDLLQMMVARAQAESRSVDNWLDLHLREHFYGEVALMPEAARNLVVQIRPPREISQRKRAGVYKKSGGVCHYCRTPIDPFYGWEADHVVPVSAGGGSNIENLVAACPTCNAKKGVQSAEEFKKQMSA